MKVLIGFGDPSLLWSSGSLQSPDSGVGQLQHISSYIDTKDPFLYHGL